MALGSPRARPRLPQPAACSIFSEGSFDLNEHRSHGFSYMYVVSALIDRLSAHLRFWLAQRLQCRIPTSMYYMVLESFVLAFGRSYSFQAVHGSVSTRLLSGLELSVHCIAHWRTVSG